MPNCEYATTRLPNHSTLSAASTHYGDSFWIVSLDRIVHNINAFRDAFQEAGLPSIELGWSVKTQWCPDVLRAAFAEGAAAEVVSAHEMDLALRLGADPKRLIFNGVGKSVHDIERGVALGARVHLDGEDEVADLLQIAAMHPRRMHCVGLRANIDLGNGQRSRFGLDAESGQLQSAFKRLNKLPNVTVNSLHAHASGARSLDTFARRIGALIDLTDQLWCADSPPDYLDIGGGFCGKVPEELSRQLSAPMPTLTEYASTITEIYLRRWANNSGPALIMEPGVALAADALWFAAKVLAVKHVSGQRHAITSASVFTVKPMRHPFDMPFVHVAEQMPQASSDISSTVVSGYTCMESDILHSSTMAPLNRGDWLLFSNCGAYSNVLTPRFIRAVPAVLRLENGALKLSMRAEGVDDWLLTSASLQ